MGLMKERGFPDSGELRRTYDARTILSGFRLSLMNENDLIEPEG